MSNTLDNLFILDVNKNVWELILRLFIACVCGFFIGYERKTRSKEAGIRTHTIVCMASALMMIVSKYAFSDMPNDKFDASRIASQIITGIGFLGAGMIFYRRDVLHGLTTAAGVWATAGIGMAIGSGLIIIGIFSTIMLILLQVFFHLPLKVLKGKHYSIIRAQLVLDEVHNIETIKSMFNIKKFLKFKTLNSSDGKTIIADVEFVATRVYTAEELFTIVKESPFVQTIEKNEEI